MRTGEHGSRPRQCSAVTGRPQSARLRVSPAVVHTRQLSASHRRTETVAQASSATKDELQGNLKRWEESGKQGNADSWQWTLNWNEIDDKILVGSCPRSTKDVVELKRVAEVDAILCLQSDGCFEALKIDYGELREKGAQLGLVMSRVAIWDFNHSDQALMIPEAIRKLALLLAMGKRVYVHCTAGINRATLTVVGYLTFVKGWTLEAAVHEVKTKRPQAHPYLDCWHTMRTRFTEGRTQEVLQTASRLYEQRKAAGREDEGDSVADWVTAENMLITEQYQRQIQADLSMMMSLNEVEAANQNNSVCLSIHEYDNMQAEMGLLREKAEKDRAKARSALASVAQVSDENRRLREANPDAVALLESSERKARLKAAEKEIDALKGAIRQVAFSALAANSGQYDEHTRTGEPFDPSSHPPAANSDSAHFGPSGVPLATTVTEMLEANNVALSDKENGANPTSGATNGAVVDVDASEVPTVKPSRNGSDKAAKFKDPGASERSTARAHNGATPTENAGTAGSHNVHNGNGNGSTAVNNNGSSNGSGSNGSTPPSAGPKWGLSATWPFRKNRKDSKGSSNVIAHAAHGQYTPEATGTVSNDSEDSEGLPKTPEVTESSGDSLADSKDSKTAPKTSGDDYAI